MADKIKDISGASDPGSVLTCALQGIYDTDRDLYRAIYGQLQAPDWAGFNLDALFDILTTEVSGPVAIHWSDFDAVKNGDVKMNLAIADVMREAAGERDDLTFVPGEANV